ncbi:MAG: hypothetical protein IKO47_00825 [Ruminococcus sp.]|nr:hypothetical protein [Ruminococcus sp.]
MFFKKAAAVITAGLMTLFCMPAVNTAYADKDPAAVSQEEYTGPKLAVDSVVLEYSEAQASLIHKVNIRVSGVEGKYACIGFHIHWDSSLNPIKNGSGQIVTAGKALGNMQYEEHGFENGVFFTAFSPTDTGKDGIIASLSLKLPKLPDKETEYPVWITFEESEKSADMFTDYEDTKDGQLMQKQIIEKGLVPGGIKVLEKPVTTTTTTTTTAATDTSTVSDTDTTTGTGTTKVTSSTTTSVTTKTGTKTTTNTATSTTTTKPSTTTTTATTSALPPERIGDLDKNSKITAVDASKVLKVCADLADGGSASDDLMFVCDVNRNGKIEATDASLILVYCAAASGSEKTTLVDYLKKKGIKI